MKTLSQFFTIKMVKNLSISAGALICLFASPNIWAGNAGNLSQFKCAQIFQFGKATQSEQVHFLKDHKTGNSYDMHKDLIPKVGLADLADDPELHFFAPSTVVDYMNRSTGAKTETVLVSTAALRESTKNLVAGTKTKLQFKVPVLIAAIGGLLNALGYKIPVYKHLHSRIHTWIANKKEKKFQKLIAQDTFVELPVWYVQILRIAIKQYHTKNFGTETNDVDYSLFTKSDLALVIQGAADAHMTIIDDLRAKYGIEVNVDLKSTDFQKIFEESPQMIAILDKYISEGLSISFKEQLTKDFVPGEIVRDLRIQEVNQNKLTGGNFSRQFDRINLNIYGSDDTDWPSTIIRFLRHELSHRQVVKSKPKVSRMMMILHKLNFFSDQSEFHNFVTKQSEEHGPAYFINSSNAKIFNFLKLSLFEQKTTMTTKWLQEEIVEIENVLGTPKTIFTADQRKIYSDLITKYQNATSANDISNTLNALTANIHKDLMVSMSKVPWSTGIAAIGKLHMASDIFELFDEVLAHNGESESGRAVNFDVYTNLNPAYLEPLRTIFSSQGIFLAFFEDPKHLIDYLKIIAELNRNNSPKSLPAQAPNPLSPPPPQQSPPKLAPKDDLGASDRDWGDRTW